MENVSELSFSNDEEPPAAKPSKASQPMVVVQYRQRGVPWWLLSLLTVFAPICAILIYHALVVGRYRAETVESAEAVRTWLKNAPRAESKKAPDAALPLPLALNSQPIATPELAGSQGALPSMASSATPGLPSPSAAPSSATATAARDQAGNVASGATVPGTLKPGMSPSGVDPAQAQKTQGAPSSGGAQSVSSPSVDGSAATTPALAAGGARSPSTGVGRPPATVSNPSAAAPLKPPVDSVPPPSSPTATAAMQFVERNKDRLSSFERSPFEDPEGDAAHSKPGQPAGSYLDRPSAEHALAKAEERGPAGAPGGPGIPPVEQPLPTKEETERQIEQEAAQNRAQLLEMQEKKDAELRSSRYQERVKFRDELRAALEQHSAQAGPEINQLAKRYSYDADRERLGQAHQLWRTSRMSQANKVRMIRALDLPETVILDLLSDDFHAQVRTRNGPRNENEVRIRAAQQLLRLELPPEDAMPAVRTPVDLLPGRTLRSRTAPLPSDRVQRRR